VRILTVAIVAMVLLAPPSGTVSAQSQDVIVDQIPVGAPSWLGKQLPELSPGTDISEQAARKIGKPINCTGASKATKPECFTATLQGRRSH
jgi:hypothetical protein